jgi:hypothetical protein
LPDDVAAQVVAILAIACQSSVFPRHLNEATKLAGKQGKESVMNNAPRAWGAAAASGTPSQEGKQDLGAGDRLARVLKEGSYPRYRTERESGVG